MKGRKNRKRRRRKKLNEDRIVSIKGDVKPCEKYREIGGEKWKSRLGNWRMRRMWLDGLAIRIPIIKFNHFTYLWTLTNLTIASSPFKLYCIVVHTYCRILLCVAHQLAFLFDPSFIYLLLAYFLSLSISLIHFISIPSPELSNILSNTLDLPILYRFSHRYIKMS